MKKRHDSLLHGVCVANSEAKSRRLLAGFAVLLITAIFTLAGCEQPTDGGDDDDVFTGTFISGSFSKDDGGEVKFGLKQDEAAPAASVQALRSVSADAGNSLNGVLEDGGIAVRLTGIYDPDTGNWSVSARSGSAIYAVDGNFNTSTGDSEGSIATVVVNDSEKWTPSAFLVSERSVNVPESADASKTGLLPAAAQGTWTGVTDADTSGNSLEANCLVSDWKMYITGTRYVSWDPTPLNQDITILEVAEKGGAYEIIYCYPEYVMTVGNFKKALAEYMGIDEDDIKVLDGPPEGGMGAPVEGYFVFDVDGDDGHNQPRAGGFDGREDVPRLAAFGASGFWKRWAARNSIATKNRYEKCKVSFPDDNTLEMIQMVKEVSKDNYTYYFDSLAELKAATLVEEKGYYHWDDGGEHDELDYRTKVITYTRSQ
jgi:hypothetical protein